MAQLIKESSCIVGDLGSIPGLGRSPEEGNSYPLQYSNLENSVDCMVHGVAKRRTRLSNFHFTVIINTVILHRSKPIECTTLTVRPNITHGLWIIMKCQWCVRFNDSKKCTSLVQGVDRGKIVCVRSGKVEGMESLYFLFKLAMNLKWYIKIESVF